MGVSGQTTTRGTPAARAHLQSVIAQREWKVRQAQYKAARTKRLLAMEACVSAGWTMAATARMFGVTRGYISNVIARRQGKGLAPDAKEREG